MFLLITIQLDIEYFGPTFQILYTYETEIQGY